MRHLFRVVAFVIAALAFASQASAQALPWKRGFFNVNFGIQMIAEDVATTSSTFTLYDETGKLTPNRRSTAPRRSGFRRGRARRRQLRVGFAYSRLSATGTAAVDAEVPSPIFYDAPRKVTASVDDLDHVENGYHFQALWMLPITDRWTSCCRRASWFSLTKGIVTSPQITEVGPRTRPST